MRIRKRLACVAGVAVALSAGVSAGQLAPASPIEARAGASEDARLTGSVAVSVAGMAQHASFVCLPPECVPSPGRVLQHPFEGMVVEARGSLYASIQLPVGVRIQSLDIFGFNAADPGRSETSPSATLFEISATRPGARSLAVAFAPMGRDAGRAAIARGKVLRRVIVGAGMAYYIQVSFVPASAGDAQAGVSMVRVNYTSEKPRATRP